MRSRLTRRQQADEWALVVALSPRPLHVERHALHKALPKRIANVISCCHQGAVLTERLDHTHSLKFAQPILIVRDL